MSLTIYSETEAISSYTEKRNNKLMNNKLITTVFLKLIIYNFLIIYENDGALLQYSNCLFNKWMHGCLATLRPF